MKANISIVLYKKDDKWDPNKESAKMRSLKEIVKYEFNGLISYCDRNA